MEGNAKIISFINRDENLHMGFTTHVLRLLADEPSEGFQHIVKECEDIVYQMYRDAASEEMEWAKYLFKDGTMIGLNSEILIQYMKWLTNNRLKAIRLDTIFEKVPNPISWITNWTESKSIQEAPQETEKETYVVGAFQQLDDNENFDEFSM
jgi:ribonucleoside-diphosphate reductase beta chain